MMTGISLGQLLIGVAFIMAAWGAFAAWKMRSKGAGPAQPPKEINVTHVKIVDIDMPFGSMVAFMVKWVLASIPAFIILAILAAGVMSFISLLR
ncbi:MAG: hypothetical protein V7688_09415 [Alcanivorax jadensis]|uniref:hypothetical protein n=1 Tax=Alcanivorax jadensis TaxID=64988 RepID=UPI0030033A4B